MSDLSAETMMLLEKKAAGDPVTRLRFLFGAADTPLRECPRHECVPFTRPVTPSEVIDD